MAQNVVQPDLRIIQLCADLAKFAYTSGDPGSRLSLRMNNDQAAKTALHEILNASVPLSGQIADFQRYYSSSWFIPKSCQPRWFRSYAYFCHVEGRPRTEDQRAGVRGKVVDRIIVGFRGTWNDSSASGRWMSQKDADEVSQTSRSWSMFTWIKSQLTPSSNYSISDFYYDMMLIRTPYREGTIWKWYAYWGSLIMGMTSQRLTWCRTVAKDWMMTVPGTSTNEPNNGHVHLGFWSLWASPEGFAGYDRQGRVKRKDSIIHDVRRALEKARSREADIEVYVVGHSLGGAVSSFAALDIAKEMEQYSDAKMYHVTFGLPPVGSAAFAAYSRRRLGHHESWNISHERDLIPQCFAWCATKKGLNRLHWWSDWSSFGKKRVIRKLMDSDIPAAPTESHEVGKFEKLKLILAGLGGLIVLCGCSVLVVPASAAWYVCRLCYYRAKGNEHESQDESKYIYGQGDPLKLGPDVGLEYHSLQTYIDLMKKENALETPTEREAAR